jgi:hypothetical protein
LFHLAIASKSISWSRLTVLLVIFLMWGESSLIASQIDEADVNHAQAIAGAETGVSAMRACRASALARF